VSTVWDDALAEEEQRALHPGAPDRLDPTPDVLVVGGGVTGLAIAVFCRRAGVERVVVIDRDRLASGPSGRAAGTLTPGIHALLRPGPFVTLAGRGLELHRDLDEEWGNAARFRTIDTLVAVPMAPPADLLEPSGAMLVDGVTAREIEPEFGEVEHAIHIPHQGAIRPLGFALQLAARAGQVATDVTMTGLETAGDRVDIVHTSHGDVSPGAVVLATGISDLVPVPQQRIKGHMLATEPAPFSLRTLPAGLIGLVQVADGRIVAGGTLDPGDDAEDVREHVIDVMLEEVHRLLPRTKALGVTHRWTCFRPGVPDELPFIDRVPCLENAWASIGHFRTGIMVAPAAAEILASWITTGERPALAEPFGIERFAT
jgi:glycine/D-amino acid oxidase-like deaminating enzyme